MREHAEPIAELRFEAEVIHWRGPSPYFFVPLPDEAAGEIRRIVRAVTYGWGMVPVEARIGDTAFRTSLFPKSDTYLLPLKDAVRRQTNVTAGDRATVEMTVRIGVRRP
jgi:hypothetical protein